jgi:hypothetical protein
MKSLVWHEDNDAGIDAQELYELLRTHGFVDESWLVVDADTARRVGELARDIMAEIRASEGERAYAATCKDADRDAQERGDDSHDP